MANADTVILGAGIAGLSAGYHLNLHGQAAVLYEKRDRWGGMCDSFCQDGFTFDHGAHLSFTKDEYVKKLFKDSSAALRHIPRCWNYDRGRWIRHPLQNNLLQLDTEEKIRILEDFIERPRNPIDENRSYEDWLIAAYGRYFAENYPGRYTRKYWCQNCRDMGIDWIDQRMNLLSLRDMLYGAFEQETGNQYYIKQMLYPEKGGYRAFLSQMAAVCRIEYGKEVVEINPKKKSVAFADGRTVFYERLLSSIPLPAAVRLIADAPWEIVKIAAELDYTSVALVSVAASSPITKDYHWFYIYDEEIKPARASLPVMKSHHNVPSGKGSVQFETYFNGREHNTISESKLVDHVLTKGEEMGLFDKSSVLFADYRFCQYANVTCTKGARRRSETVKKFLKDCGISVIGRYGEWDYLWSDQSLLSGKKAAEEAVRGERI